MDIGFLDVNPRRWSKPKSENQWKWKGFSFVLTCLLGRKYRAGTPGALLRRYTFGAALKMLDWHAGIPYVPRNPYSQIPR